MKGNLVLDWLAFTFKPPVVLLDQVDNVSCPSQLSLFRSMFPELNDIWSVMEIRGSKNHYNQSVAFGSDFMCFFNETNDNTPIGQNMGVNFEVPSHSLKLFFDLMHININKPDAVRKMMRLLYDRGCRCSRIDLCYDDYDKVYRADELDSLWIHNCFRTHFQRSRCDHGCSGKPGSTFYLGNLKKRDKILRVYDKDIQSQGFIDAVRWEFELHTKYAQDMQIFLMEHNLQFGLYIKDWFEIIDPIYPENKSMCPITEKWSEFVNKDIFCEKLSDILVPVLSRPAYRMSRKQYVEVYLPRVLKDYVSYYGWEQLFETVNHSSNSPNYHSDNDSIKLRSLVDDPLPLRGFEYCSDSPFVYFCEVPTSAGT